MGCCVSTAKNGATAAPPSICHVDGSKSPPTAEEEAVKEVLSETPHKPISPNPYLYASIPKTSSLASSNNGFPSMMSALDSAHRKLLHSPRKQIGRFNPAPDEISDVSEISDSVPAGEARQRVPRSPSPGRIQRTDPGGFRRERLAGKSPVKRSDPSPRRTGSGREPGQVVVRDRLGGPDGQRRREPGENSGRRSGSPGTRNEAGGSRSNVGRSLSGRKNGLSPGKIRMVQPGTGPGGGGGDGDGGGRDSWEMMNPMAPSESLENPLVSLECFIFL